MEQSFFCTALCIMVYCPLSDEVDIMPVIKKIIADGKKLIVPKTDVENHTIIPCLVVNPEKDLSSGYSGILEPKAVRPVSYGQIDVILVPGRVFDRSGCRIGRGVGCYDRFLRNIPGALKVGVAFDFQLVDRIEPAEHDICMDMLITEKTILKNENFEKTTIHKKN
jgi:5-formyltetrahydrofolate cyclo-ligase